MIQHGCRVCVSVCADAFHSVMLTAQREGGCNKEMSMGELTSTNNPIIIPVKPAISVVLLDRWAYWAPAPRSLTPTQSERQEWANSVPTLWFTYSLYSSLLYNLNLLVAALYPMMLRSIDFHQIHQKIL